MSTILRLDATTHLESVTEEDADALFRVVAANRAFLRRWLPWLDANTSAEDTRDFVRTAIRSESDETGLVMLIRCRGEIIGVIGFNAIDRLNRCAEIGYWLAAAAQGRGTATRAVRALVEHGFARLGLHRIAIRVATGNARSRAIPERLGFVHEGVQRDAEWLYDHYENLDTYALLHPDGGPPAGDCAV